MKIFPTLSPYLTGILLAIWLGFFLYGKRQFQLAKKITLELPLNELKKARRAIPNLTVEKYYAYLYPIWETEIRDKIRMILHKSELFTIKATPEVVRDRLNFSPEWLGAYLKVNKRPLAASEELQDRINEIVGYSQKLAPPDD
jgi:hypothetical protein